MEFECTGLYEKEWMKEKLEAIIPNKKFILKKSEYTVNEMYDKFKKEINKYIKKDRIYDFDFLNEKSKAMFNGVGFDKSYINKTYNYKETRNTLMYWIEDMISEEIQEDCDCEVCRYNRFLIKMENYIPPEEYPDWDGDESIMYYLDHYVEEDDDDLDEYEED